ncbi:MAG: hypothetical protein ACXWVS_06535, partial [Hyphomicrobium sp.]
RDYLVNAEALAYMRQRALAGPVIAKLAAHPKRHFEDEVAWMRHLERLGITLAEGHARSGAPHHRRSNVGQHQGARPLARHGHPVR